MRAQPLTEQAVADAVFTVVESYLADGLFEQGCEHDQHALIGVRGEPRATIEIDGRSFRLTIREVRR